MSLAHPWSGWALRATLPAQAVDCARRKIRLEKISETGCCRRLLGQMRGRQISHRHWTTLIAVACGPAAVPSGAAGDFILLSSSA